MARDIDSPILWKDAVEYFNCDILPGVEKEYEQDGIPDWPARRETWNNWTDMLCKNEQISDWQYENWSQPRSCG